ncbi:hypothetical protein FB45DRAFT_255097 [Roridomyces roridus]|uniref:Uncharacterized protein n=1 Tax=Roridomyces roridus TaxID=1738132 RepID=A0AAD7FDX8_9AGAR|nr:hypothetical protein FB45DRAFT_255097 [Roridomyces roridus]
MQWIGDPILAAAQQYKSAPGPNVFSSPPSLSMNLPRVLDATHARSVNVDMQDLGSGETLLGKPWEPTEMRSSCRRSTLSLSLHVALVAIQLVLLVAWHQEWEHRIIFSVDHELLVAQLVKGMLTTFITLYSALLVFVTQSLTLRQDLHTRQLLTATHDNAVAWSGLGSAVVRLWQQRVIPASTMGVLSALTYLAGVSALHTAFPGVAAPQSLFVSQSLPISTQGLPTFDFSGVDENDRRSVLTAAGQYAGDSLAFLPFLTPSNALGLYEATLYDVLGPNAGTGPVRVNATSFNISCGYIPDTAFNSTTHSINVGGTDHFLDIPDKGVIATVELTPHKEQHVIVAAPITFPSPALFYTSIPVLDSKNNTAPWFQPFNFSAQTVQVFRCSLGLVEQTVFVDSQSHNLTSFALEIPLEKKTSTWLPFSGQLNNLSTAAFSHGQSGFLDIWEAWYTAMPQMELYPFNTTWRQAVYLHEVENQLAKIVASMFWILGHVPPLSSHTSSAQLLNFNVSLLAGQATGSRSVIQDRLDLNVISIVECLVSSLILLVLSLRFSRLRQREACATKIDRLDVLQSIWLYRDHPELAANLEQVQVPRDVNLRRAGMLRVQLIDGTAGMRELSDSQEIWEMSDELSGATCSRDKKSRKEPERLGSTWSSDLVLSLVSTALHSALVAIHLLLVVGCVMEIEHKITFPLSQQSLVAWLISTVATVFITIYTAGLLFLTQTLSIKRSLRKTQMLTVTHDTFAAWQGLGSALSSVWHRTSFSAVVPIFLYLTGILALHITSPALFTVQVFNSTVPVQVTTQGIPTFAFSGYNVSSPKARMDPLFSPLTYAQAAFSYLPFVNSSPPALGLEGGMLYNVLNTTDSGTGNATVDSVQLNMTCGYFSDPVVNSTAPVTGEIGLLGSEYVPSYTDIGIISTLQYDSWIRNNFSSDWFFASSTVFYSTVPISDSAGNTGPLVDISSITGPGSAAKVQIFGCSLGLVNTSVTIDSKSRILPDERAFQKDSSVWSPFQGSLKYESTDPYDVLANDWDSWYIAMPASRIYQATDENSDAPQPFDEKYFAVTVADMFFIERLSLNSTGSSVTLHEFEEALAELVASMYWTLGHVAPPFDSLPMGWEDNGSPPVEVSLLQGNTLFFADSVEARFDANMAFIILGTVVSGVLFLLSLHFSVFRTTEDEEIISGMGPLHIIWLYRNHPELEEQLEQVVDPTTSNLRKAGMVRTRLAGPKVESFLE